MDGFYQLVPPQGNFSFDLMVEVGLARLRDNQQDTEIRTSLEQRWGLPLPEASISLLVESFLDGLAAIHQVHLPILKARFRSDGGYVLHVDGTCEPGTDVLFMAVAEPRGWVLETAKMTSETTAEIRAVIHRCAEGLGEPLALVRDLSFNIQEAANQAIPGVPNLICQFHFLENVGEKLCEKPHAQLTKAIRRLKIRPTFQSLRREILRASGKTSRMSRTQVESLLSNPKDIAELGLIGARRYVGYLFLRWLDDYSSDLRGEYFPFDLPSLAFYRRAAALSDLLVSLFATQDFPAQEVPVLGTMLRHLAIFREDAELVASAHRVEQAASLFDELRTTLRLTSDPRERLIRGRSVHADGQCRETTEQCAEALERWSDQLRERNQHETDLQKKADQETVLKYLEKYKVSLSGHIIPRENQLPLIVARTNNPAEHRFQALKQGLRRRVGAKKLTRHIHAMRAETLLVQNLADPEYVRLVVGESLEDLATMIARHWPVASEFRRQRQTTSTTHPIPTTKKQLRNPALLDALAATAAELLKITPREGAAA